jgi:hypothetical protein
VRSSEERERRKARRPAQLLSAEEYQLPQEVLNLNSAGGDRAAGGDGIAVDVGEDAGDRITGRRGDAAG